MLSSSARVILDVGERKLLHEAGVSVIATELVDRIGMYEAVKRAIEIASRDTDGIYLSLDLDSLDPVYAPGVGTPVPGGLTYREAHLACDCLPSRVNWSRWIWSK